MQFLPLVRRAALPGGIILWLIALGFGFRQLMVYSLTPGTSPTVAAAQDWPTALPFPRNPSHQTLVVTLHPECPCSKATLTELGRVFAAAPQTRGYAIFESYGSLPEPIENSDLWRQASEIPGMTMEKDSDGAIALKLGARTSGDVRLFSREGSLLFQGGVTGSRGHAGANPASDAVIALATGSSTTPCLGVPTFGCALDR